MAESDPGQTSSLVGLDPCSVVPLLLRSRHQLPFSNPPTLREEKMQRNEGAPSAAASSVQNTLDELELMKRRLVELEAKKKNILEEYITDQHSSFSKDILAKPLLEKLKIP
ncbi:Uncharacterized protein Adt_16505 [Abeliophyllum distichum]|uniref:Uncharacterized protein n=1 Tax=Abeliophyllum distichum TaxID=126358 RepID=A0ABD1TEC3_9LAMI